MVAILFFYYWFVSVVLLTKDDSIVSIIIVQVKNLSILDKNVFNFICLVNWKEILDVEDLLILHIK